MIFVIEMILLPKLIKTLHHSNHLITKIIVQTFAVHSFISILPVISLGNRLSRIWVKLWFSN